MSYRFPVGSVRSRANVSVTATFLAAVLLGLLQPAAAMALIPVPVTCQPGTPVACGDAFVCTTDSCNENTKACVHDFSTCMCGDMEVTGNEERDPPVKAGTLEDCNNSIDDDGDGKVDCRDKDCKPTVVRNPPICGEDCTVDLVCAKFLRGPAIIRYNSENGLDEFYVHGRMPMFGNLDSAVRGVTVELASGNGAVYRAFLFGGDMRGRIGGRFYRFRDDSAAFLGRDSERGGLQKLWLRRRKFHGVRTSCSRSARTATSAPRTSAS